jgi:serine/threonine protein kinase
MSPGPGKIGDFKVIQELGSGGMGRVYLAEDPRLRRRVAIKTFQRHDSGGPSDLLERFKREAVAQARLQHPNIVPLYSFGEEGDLLYLVMPFVDGTPLQEVIRRDGKLPLDTVKTVFQEVAAALDHAHQSGVIHRDLKPSNIMISREGVAQLMDFGIARLSSSLESDARTVPGFVIGTPQYLSPEAIRGGEIGPQADVFGLGVVVYEMLCGRRPFEADNTTSLLFSIVSSEPPPIRQERPEAGAALENAVKRALEKDPSRRFQTAGDFYRAAFGDAATSDEPRAEASSAEDAGEGAKRPRSPEMEEVSPLRGGSGTWKLVAAVIAAPGILVVSWFYGLVVPAVALIVAAGLVLGALTWRRPVPAPRSPSRSTARTGPLEVPAPLSTPQENPSTVLEPRPSLVPPPPAEDAATRSPSGDATLMFPRPSATASPSPRMQLVVTASADRRLNAVSIPITHFPFRIGRTGCDLDVADPGLSREHAILESESGGYFIRDSGSRNGTYLDGRRLPPSQRVVLPYGASIRLSQATTLSFHLIEPAPLPDLSGVVVENRYRLVRLLRAGSKSALYEATDEKLGQQMAIKVLHPQLADTPGYTLQFEREAKTAASLSHSAICGVQDFGSTLIAPSGGSPFRTQYLCMKLMEGGSLAAKIEEKTPVAVQECLRWCRRIAEALEAAHGEQIVHGGIKPSSIVFDRFGQAYLADFATSSRVGSEKGGTILGAPAYLAPEQWDGREATPRTDQYSLAAVIYRILAGEPVFEGQEYPEVRRRNFARGPVSAHVLAEQNGMAAFPKAVSASLARALSVEPGDRFPSVAAFQSAFELSVVRPSASERAEPRIFISYRREASSGWPNLFSAVLKEKYEIESFLDVQGLDHAGRFPEQIRRTIVDSDAFVCFVNAETLKSDWVRQELQFAHENGKPLIPILHEGFEKLSAEVPRDPWIVELLDSQGVRIFDLQNLYIDAAIHQLAALIRTVRT